MVDLIAQLRRAEKDLFNGENWAAIPQRKAKLWKFENIRTLAVADTLEEVMRYVWNSCHVKHQKSPLAFAMSCVKNVLKY